MSAIYKYYPINKYTLKSIINNELFFSNPLNFNDPFELEHVPVFHELDKNELIEYLNKNKETKAILNYFKGDVRLAEKALFKTYIKTQNKKGSLYLKDGLSEKVGVSCFSENCDNFLMWSHYGDMHRGVSLGFDKKQFLVEQEVEFSLSNVKYKKNVPKIKVAVKGLGVGPDNIEELILTKLKHWEYENEVRCVLQLSSNDHSKILNFLPICLKTVTFGCKINKEDKELIINLVRKDSRYSHVKFRDTLMNTETSSLSLKELTI